MSVGINVDHPMPYVHTQNGPGRSFHKAPSNDSSDFGYENQTAGICLGLWNIALSYVGPPEAHRYPTTFTITVGHWIRPNVSHLRVFGCAIYMPIAPPLRTKMGPQRKMGIYVGYDLPSIVRYLEPLTGDLFTARFADCQFDETIFPSLGGDKHADVLVERRELSWYAPIMSHLDPFTAQSETEVR